MRHHAEEVGRNQRPDASAATEMVPPSGLLHEKQIPAPRLAQLIMIVVICGYGVVSVIYPLIFAPSASRQGLALGVACGISLVVAQLHICLAGRGTWSLRRRVSWLAVQAVLISAPVAVNGYLWGHMAAPLAGTALLLLATRAAWTIYGLATVSVLVLALALKYPSPYFVYFPESTALAGLAIYGLTRLTDLVREAHAARGALARMAVAQERLRFARELHGLLGHSVSAITLKSELVRRLVPARLTRARTEIASALEVARQALSDVRIVAGGYREMSLEAEAKTTASILATANVDTEMDVRCGPLHPLVDTTLATVLREGVTNVLRHSRVKVCAVSAHIQGDVARLTLVNDGVTGQDIATHGSGSGLSNLATRLSSIGGTLEAGVIEDGRFRLLATAPLRPENASPRPVDRAQDSRNSPAELVDQHIPAPRLARSITVMYPFGYASVMVLGVIAQSSGIPRAIGLTCVISLFLIQLGICVKGRSTWPLRRRVQLIVTQVALLVALFAITGPLYGGMAALLAGTALLLLPSRAAWSLFGLTISGVAVVGVLSGYSPLEVIFVVLNVAVAGLAIYGLTRLADLVGEVHAVRAALARVAVTQERLRFARDMHDLLGYSLSAITLQNELIYRLVPARLESARVEIRSILEVARQALSDVRAVASGYREMSLEAEFESAASILAAADVDVRVDLDCGRLDPLIDSTLATALREGMTNMLRHSNVKSCGITARADEHAVRLELVNDGVEKPGAPGSGSGLSNLSTRLEAIGGTLEAGVIEDGRFRLLATAPARRTYDEPEPGPQDTRTSRAELAL